jgi:hypothetical protein
MMQSHAQIVRPCLAVLRPSHSAADKWRQFSAPRLIAPYWLPLSPLLSEETKPVTTALPRPMRPSHRNDNLVGIYNQIDVCVTIII